MQSFASIWHHQVNDIEKKEADFFSLTQNLRFYNQKRLPNRESTF